MVSKVLLGFLTAPLITAVVVADPSARGYRSVLPLSHCVSKGTEHEENSTHLLQLATSHTKAASAELKLEPTDARSQAIRLEKALPIAWVHVPKCGSSLSNFMIHLPGVCPGLSEDLVISQDTFGLEQLSAFRDRYDPVGLTANGACGQDHFFKWGEHAGVGENWQAHYKGHGFVMLRQPEQRTLSGYHFAHHNWPRSTPPANELEYAEVLQGCAVRMFVRDGLAEENVCGGGTGPPGPPSWTEVELAIHRLRTGFAFVGLTDEWPLSMCLGHRMFGGRCRLSDFVDGRITDRRGMAPAKVKVKVLPKTRPYNTSVLHGFRDPYDGALYEAAQDIFRDEMESFGVSAAACQPCFDEAGVSFND